MNCGHNRSAVPPCCGHREVAARRAYFYRLDLDAIRDATLVPGIPADLLQIAHHDDSTRTRTNDLGGTRERVADELHRHVRRRGQLFRQLRDNVRQRQIAQEDCGLLDAFAHPQALGLARFVDLTSAGPQRLFGIAGKGRIAVGYDADFTIVDLKSERVIEDDWIGSKCGWTPFAGQKVKGWPVGTIVRGTLAMWEGELGAASGEPVRFGEALPRDPLA